MGEAMAQVRKRRNSFSDTFKYFPWLRIVLPVLLVLALFSGVVSSLPRRPKPVPEEIDCPVEVEIGELKEIVDPKKKYKDKKLLALTFDDGPSDYTNRLLDILKAKGVKVTFFALGSRADYYPDIIRREAREGHEVESHTYGHRDLSTISAGEVSFETISAAQSICNALGKQGCISYVRPPYGAVNNTVRSVIKEPLIGWSVDSLDWRSKDAAQVRVEVLTHVFDGAIVLMHDVYDSTVTGVEMMLDDLIAAGYTLVTVDELVKARTPGLSPGVLYGKFER